MKIAIDIRNGINELSALRAVSEVIRAGRVSSCRGIPLYCRLTVFPDQVEVFVRSKQSPEACDSFVVFRNQEEPK